jgi:predicted O-linked N-acetylglucosamine transferase (SPINDLY family)
VFAEARRFAARQFGHLTGHAGVPDNAPDPDRPLRIGYVSGDFRSHSVAYYLLPLLEARDRDNYRILCFVNNPREDAVTDQFRALADDWISIRGLTDDQATDRVRAASVDVLVDLSGHTAANRLGVFARRAAPVQVSWLGYPNTTGLDSIDYRITDAIADPVGARADAGYAETLYRLPGCFLCYCEDARSGAVAPPPSARNGYATFGSFNTLAKITDEVVAVWARILHAVPDARLLLKSQSLDQDSSRHAVHARFAARDIGPERVELMGLVAKEAHYQVYSRVDIALDTFPYNGTTTTCEALWMGVPVIGMQGHAHAGRVGATLLEHAGLGEFVTPDPAGYVALAQSLAADGERRAALRSSLRAHVGASPLMDKARFAARMEQAYRDMWRQWCASRS